MASSEHAKGLPSIKLTSGHFHPVVGFGTYKVGFIPASASSAVESGNGGIIPGQNADEIILDAIKTGYRMFDCAEYYGNEDLIGKALSTCGIAREELYIASKVWSTTIYQGANAIREQVLKSLADLQVTYLDLELVHWPVPNGKHVEAYKTLLDLKKEGLIRDVGVSNYTIADLEELEAAGLPIPVVNQIEINPFCFRSQTIAYCQSKGIHLQAYRALANAKHFDHPVVVQLVEKYNVTGAQVLGRWCVQHGFIYFPKSTKVHRMAQNIDVFGFELAEEDMTKLDSLTTKESIEEAGAKYQQGIVRDTPLENQLDLGKANSVFERFC